MSGLAAASRPGPPSDVERWEDDGGTPGRAAWGSPTARPARTLIAHHEAGHAAVGHAQGLTFGVVYVGDASGQVIFDDQWEREIVVRDAALLDRYGLMLLAGGHAEQRFAGGVVGAQLDAETLERMLREARARGTLPRPGMWERAERQVAECWPAIQALADELERRSSPVASPAEVLARYPYLGGAVTETTGIRAREILAAAEPSR
jgi:hypothetical protein